MIFYLKLNTIKIFPLFIFVFQSIFVSAQTETAPFKIGEKLSYTVAYNWFVVYTDVGYAQLNIAVDTINTSPLYHFIGTGRTTKSWDRFFKVRDKYESWVNTKSLKPVYFKRDVSEGGFKLDINYTFYQQSQLAKTYEKVNDKNPKRDIISIKPNTYDIISAVYYARTIDYNSLNPGDTIKVNLLLDLETAPFYYRFIEREKIKVKDLGEINCIKLGVMVAAGTVFDESGEKLFIWISDDENKIPVYAESPIVIGDVKIRLSNYENLKHSLIIK